MVVMEMEAVESTEKQQDIDDIIYDNYEEFKPYVYLYEDIAGLTSDAEVSYLKTTGTFSYMKIYKMSKGVLDYRLTVNLNMRHPDRGLNCKIEIT